MFRELQEIEKINIRVEKDIEYKRHERIRKFGVDGQKIVGIDEKEPNPHYFASPPNPQKHQPPPEEAVDVDGGFFLTAMDDEVLV